MPEIKVMDCGRDALQKVVSEHMEQGYFVLSIMCVERSRVTAYGNIYTMFTVVFWKEKEAL